MATWRDLSATKFTFNPGASIDIDQKVDIIVQYDFDSKSPTSVNIRFKMTRKNSVDYSDGMYILYNANNSPEDIGRVLRTIKAHSTSSWSSDSYTTSAITITKTHSASTFTIQDFWVCDTGNGTVNTSEQKVTYSSGTKTFYNWFKTDGDRENYCHKISATTFSLADTVTSPVGTGTVSITDNGDNTFTLKGAKGSSGDNNPSTGPTLKWGYSTSYSSDFTNGATKTLTITTASNATRTVYAKCVTGATYGSGTTATTSKAIKQYVAPGAPGKPAISVTKSRLTIKENWTISWTAAAAANTSSPIKGYRIRVYKKSAGDSDYSTIPLYGSDGALKSSDIGSGTGRYYYDRDLDAVTNDTSMSFVPSNNSIEPGDSIKIGIYAYTENGKGSKLFNSSQVFSEIYTVQNAGIMYYKTGGKWQEAPAYYKSSNTWKESPVYYKTGGKWQETE